MPDRLVVTAPASSANLGPGFDCMAIALDLRNRVELRRQGDAQVVVESEGEGAGEAPGGPDNLFVRAFEAAGADSRGLTVRMTNRIPFARGLGSSAATIAAGLVAGRAWAGAGEDDLLSLATALEGHPDNVAAALNGGVTLAWTTDGVPAAVGLGDPGFELVAVVPSQQLSTAAARAALPASVPHADAVHTAARAALLVAALGWGTVTCWPRRWTTGCTSPTGRRWRRCLARCASGCRRYPARWAPRSRAPARRCWSGAGRKQGRGSRTCCSGWTAPPPCRWRWPNLAPWSNGPARTARAPPAAPARGRQRAPACRGRLPSTGRQPSTPRLPGRPRAAGWMPPQR
ncbi:MAG TPA: hypothetical protein VM823_05330 [Gaiellales bacterium]|nr:hypothetical protein [Gaiellales bacterium]